MFPNRRSVRGEDSGIKLARYLERINDEIQQSSTLMERDCLRNVNLTYNN